MKNRFHNRLEALLEKRFRERDRRFNERLVEVQQEYHSRGILFSSVSVKAMHAEFESEFAGSAAESVRAAVDVMRSGQSTLLLPRRRSLLRYCSAVLSRRKDSLQTIFDGPASKILGCLSDGMTAPYQSLSENFFELHVQNACVELGAKHSELFWSRLDRVSKLLAFVKLRHLVIAVALATPYVLRAEITGAWEYLLSLLK